MAKEKDRPEKNELNSVLMILDFVIYILLAIILLMIGKAFGWW